MCIGRASAFALLAAVACAGPLPAATDEVLSAAKVCAAGATLRGIDVSVYQGNIDWAQVKASGVVFALIRVSDGLPPIDSKFHQNWEGARAAGVIRGVYQFFRENEDPIAQADELLAEMGPLEPDDLPPVIDVESSDGQTQATCTDHIGQWLAHVQAATGRTPIIYTGLYSWPSISGSSAYADIPLWVPQYGPTCPTLPAPWTNWTFFQYTDKGTIPGIAGNVDGDYFNGDLDALMAFIGAPGRPVTDASVEMPPDAQIVVDAPDARPVPGTRPDASATEQRLSGELTASCAIAIGGGRGTLLAPVLLLLLVARRSRRGSSRSRC